MIERNRKRVRQRERKRGREGETLRRLLHVMSCAIHLGTEYVSKLIRQL